MATLNTLRTKFGIVLSAVIAFALLAFIFSLKSEMGFSGNDPVVATLDGQDITYSEYQAEYNKIRAQNNVDESNQQQLDALSDAALQSLLTNYVLSPSFKNLGVNISDSERLAMISGEIPTQSFYNVFADPSTGIFNRDMVNMFLLQSSSNPEAEAFWAYLNDQARIERESAKFAALLNGGTYVNSLEVSNTFAKVNNSYSGRWASKSYMAIPDSVVSVSTKEVSDFYQKNKARYKKNPTRTISYVKFDIVPTSEDRFEIENTAVDVGEDFAATEDVRGFVRDNRYGTIAPNYVMAAQLLADEATALKSGEMYGPVLSNNTWRISRVLDSRLAPDTLGIRIIVLPYTSTDLADSLETAIKGGADFGVIAAMNSLHQESAQAGGEMGMVPYSAFTTEMADALATATEGSVVRVEVGDMIQIVSTYNVGPKTEHYKVAAIEYPVVASQSTINKAHADAGTFAVEAKGSANFQDVANKNAVSSFAAQISQGDREFATIESSRAIARWAYGAKQNDLSEIFRVDDGYIVAKLISVDDSEYVAMNDVISKAITTELIEDKKAAYVKSTIKGSTFDEMVASLGASANSGTFSDVDFSAYYIAEVGVEPAVVGAITSSQELGKVAVVAGNSGVYVVEVTEIEENEEPLSAESVKVGLQASAENIIQQMIYPAIQNISNIVDSRSLYF
ncbi:MAG: peptidylprolyl isomerase [Rikenellaceae bacterium]